ncbi:MAG: GvpL/GvpF family gas vesicle protein [bacterium]|nr:GvpL/GvpF family gas vesicle protein [bacterium]
MEKENSENSKMENIFYAALALHVAGKSLNKENIRVVLYAAGTPVNEPTLDIIGAFIESLKVSRGKNDGCSDSKIIELLTTVLSQQHGPTDGLETLLRELNGTVSTESYFVTQLDDNRIPETGESSEQLRYSEKAEHLQAVNGDAGVAVDKVSRKESETISQHKGRYVYGVTAGGKEVCLGPMGIDGNEVYTVSYQDLSAIVHCCPTKPYQSMNDETVKRWLQTHQSVLDAAKEQFDVIIPLGFDTILKTGDDNISADQVIRDWLKKDSDTFHALISQIEGRDEYVVQVSYSPSAISKYMSEPSEEVKQIREELVKKSPGIAYIYKQKLEKAIKADMDQLADSWFKDFYYCINKHVDNVIVEKTKKLGNEMVMLLNCSCLVAKEKVDSLGEELEIINNMEGFSVHFSGPWPAYSFVTKKPITVVAEEG